MTTNNSPLPRQVLAGYKRTAPDDGIELAQPMKIRRHARLSIGVDTSSIIAMYCNAREDIAQLFQSLPSPIHTPAHAQKIPFFVPPTGGERNWGVNCGRGAAQLYHRQQPQQAHPSTPQPPRVSHALTLAVLPPVDHVERTRSRRSLSTVTLAPVNGVETVQSPPPPPVQMGGDEEDEEVAVTAAVEVEDRLPSADDGESSSDGVFDPEQLEKAKAMMATIAENMREIQAQIDERLAAEKKDCKSLSSYDSSDDTGREKAGEGETGAVQMMEEDEEDPCAYHEEGEEAADASEPSDSPSMYGESDSEDSDSTYVAEESSSSSDGEEETSCWSPPSSAVEVSPTSPVEEEAAGDSSVARLSLTAAKIDFGLDLKVERELDSQYQAVLERVENVYEARKTKRTIGSGELFRRSYLVSSPIDNRAHMVDLLVVTSGVSNKQKLLSACVHGRPRGTCSTCGVYTRCLGHGVPFSQCPGSCEAHTYCKIHRRSHESCACGVFCAIHKSRLIVTCDHCIEQEKTLPSSITQLPYAHRCADARTGVIYRKRRPNSEEWSRVKTNSTFRRWLYQ